MPARYGGNDARLESSGGTREIPSESGRTISQG